MSWEKLEQAKSNWEEKLAHYEYELSITAGAPQKFELEKRIQECQEKIRRIKAKLESIGKDSKSIENSSFSNLQTVGSSSTGSSLHTPKPNNDSKILDMKDVFICHASEDKQEVVEPLVAAFEQANISYWYDKAEIKWGDSITKKVNEGLKISHFVIVVISKVFLSKNFPLTEFYSTLNREISSGEVKVLPLIVKTNDKEKKEILNNLPFLQDKLYLTWDNNPNKVIDALCSRLPCKIEVKPTIPNNFFAYDSSWVGREKLIEQLNQKLRNSYRLLLILGLTGIGKTALAEKLAVVLQDLIQGDWKNKLLRANFDYDEKPTDFGSVAAGWLESLGEQIPPAEKKPELLLNRLVKRLQDHRFLVLIDSMEKLLTENEDGGWGDFIDKYWETFFLRLISAESCQSRLIVTSQDLPVSLHSKASRYNNFYHRHILYGLEEPEQKALFEIEGLDINQGSENRPILLRLGKAYKGHPLVLRVIIGEINSTPFNGNAQAYWNDVGSKIEEVEKDLAEAQKGQITREDEWELHKLTRQVRDKVNKERLKAVFNRLETQVPDAHILICAASVYRIPVQEEGWLMQLTALISRVEKQVCSKERQKQALEELLNRFLAEESVNHNNKRVLGQHNLVRSVALESHRNLIQKFQRSGEVA